MPIVPDPEAYRIRVKLLTPFAIESFIKLILIILNKMGRKYDYLKG